MLRAVGTSIFGSAILIAGAFLAADNPVGAQTASSTYPAVLDDINGSGASGTATLTLRA